MEIEVLAEKCYNFHCQGRLNMLEAAIKNYATYAPFLAETTKQGLASLVLENMIPSQGLMQNLVLRDTGKITDEEFFEIEMQRIKGVGLKKGKMSVLN